MPTLHRTLPILLIAMIAVSICAPIALAVDQAPLPGKPGIQAQAAAGTDTVYLTKTGECYHKGTCTCLKKSKIATTRASAIKRGYRACKLCRP